MRAIKLNTHVAKTTERPAQTIQDFLAELSARPRRMRSKEEIDRDLNHERESWD